jgi:hypothetical protein
MLDLVYRKKKCEWSPVEVSLFDVGPEALMIQGEVFTCLFVFVVVVFIAMWALFKLLGKDNTVDSSAALFVYNVSEHTQHKE